MPTLNDAIRSRMLAALARELDLDRARVLVPGFERDQWAAVLGEAAALFGARGEKPGAGPEKSGDRAPSTPPRKPGAGEGGPKARPVLFTDGASRGNPGPAAAGAAVYLGQDQVGTLSRALGVKTNNQAEYEALLLGLELVRELGFDQVSIRADSQLMVRQIQGRYKVKDPKLQPLFGRAKAALKEFSGYDITHIDRGLNQIADGLANKALDGG